MARFNAVAERPKTKTTNLAGGEAYSESARLELASLVLTSLVQDQFYRKADDGLAKMAELTKQDPLFAAKTAVFARNEYGMRSISHAVAGEVGQYAGGTTWGRAFYKAVVRRPDDITEILSYWKGKGQKKLPSAMKYGLSESFGKFDGYQLAKYRGEGRGIKLIDAVNLLHPKPTDKNREALALLVKGDLKTTETWEAKLSAAGKDDEEKEGAWRSLLAEKRLGYMALLKNLRNILQQAPELVPLACEQMVDERAIRKSLVFPFRFVKAYRELQSEPGAAPVLTAISQAADISLGNVPKLPGRTCVILDTSGSMTSLVDIANPFAIALVRAMGADLILFATTATYANVPLTISVMPGVAEIARLNGAVGHGTDLKAGIKAMKAPYDRIIILSDMQSWIGYNTPKAEFASYCTKFGVAPKIFSFDLAGYGSLQFPEKDVYAIAGFSDRVFELMETLEQDREALVKRIEAQEF